MHSQQISIWTTLRPKTPSRGNYKSTEANQSQDIHMQVSAASQSYPPLDDPEPDPFFPNAYARSGQRAATAEPMPNRLATISEDDRPMSDEAAADASQRAPRRPKPRRRRQTTSSSSRSHANSSIPGGRRFYGPDRDMNNALSGYGPTTAFPTMRQDQPSPPDSKADVLKPKAVKHKRGYQACDQCRQRKTGCVLGGM